MNIQLNIIANGITIKCRTKSYIIKKVLVEKPLRDHHQNNKHQKKQKNAIVEIMVIKESTSFVESYILRHFRKNNTEFFFPHFRKPPFSGGLLASYRFLRYLRNFHFSVLIFSKNAKWNEMWKKIWIWKMYSYIRHIICD